MQSPNHAITQSRNHSGSLPREAGDVGTGEVGSSDGSTRTRIQLRINAATGRVEEAVFRVMGGSAAIASARLLTERLQGSSITRVRELDSMTIVAELQLPVELAHVAAMAVEAASRAIDDWERKRPG
jgi:NifU-like protein involved in Fe-S cluster formation